MSKPKVYQYGYDINEIEKQIYTPQPQEREWGFFTKVNENDDYGLMQVFIKKDSVCSLNLQDFTGREAMIYLESGQASVQSNNLAPQETLLFAVDRLKEPINIGVKEDSFVYIFSGPSSGDDLRDGVLKKSKTFNFRNQYWADVLWTMVNRAYAGKKIFFKKGNNSSFHFHCQKNETYFVHSGKLLLRLRAGKGEDRYFVVNPGQAVDIPPGLVHQAGGLEDTIVIEISTRDYDNDAFLIESEFTKMPKIMGSRNLKLFLETDSPEEAEKALQKDFLSGINVRPNIMLSDYIKNVKKIAELCKAYGQEVPIGIELLGVGSEKILEQVKDLVSQINYSNLNIRIPIGWQETRIIKELTQNNIKVECFGGMNEAQAILAANAGANYFSISSFNIKDMGGDPFKIIQNSYQLLKDSDTEIIVNGIRSKDTKDVVDAFLAGAQIVSVPLAVLERMAVHPKTTENIIRFVNAYHQWGQQ